MGLPTPSSHSAKSPTLLKFNKCRRTCAKMCSAHPPTTRQTIFARGRGRGSRFVACCGSRSRLDLSILRRPRAFLLEKCPPCGAERQGAHAKHETTHSHCSNSLLAEHRYSRLVYLSSIAALHQADRGLHHPLRKSLQSLLFRFVKASASMCSMSTDAMPGMSAVDQLRRFPLSSPRSQLPNCGWHRTGCERCHNGQAALGLSTPGHSQRSAPASVGESACCKSMRPPLPSHTSAPC